MRLANLRVERFRGILSLEWHVREPDYGLVILGLVGGLDDAPDRLVEPLGPHRLEDVVRRLDLERVDGVVETDERRRFIPDAPTEVEIRIGKRRAAVVPLKPAS
jgi:hypothetical protein